MARKVSKSTNLGKQDKEDDAIGAHNLVGITKGHIIGNRVGMISKCGVESSGWFYGTIDDVSCKACLENDNEDSDNG